MNNHSTITIDDSLQLRVLKAQDAGALYRVTDKNRNQLLPWLPWVSETRSITDSAAFIQVSLANFTAGSTYGYGIFLNDELVGHMSIMDTQPGDHAKIGYWIDAAVSGKGVTTQAVKALSAFGLETLRLPRIIIHADKRNVASNRVAEKCGYARTGTFEANGAVMIIWELLAAGDQTK